MSGKKNKDSVSHGKTRFITFELTPQIQLASVQIQVVIQYLNSSTFQDHH